MIYYYIDIMRYLFFISFLISFILPQTEYIFSDNKQITESTFQDNKFPEVIIHDDIIHLTWVHVYGNTKNIMYSQSQDFGESFSEPIQVNYISNNINS